jgi:hypothetical protein
VPNFSSDSRFGPLPVALSACGLLALASLAAPIEPLYDPWAWLVWGRELAGLDLDTSSGPSWKPLPSLVAVPLSAFGAAAPDLWLALARAGWLAVPVLAWRLAARLVGVPGAQAAAAGAIAALGTILLADDFTAWVRQGAGGLAEPALAALVLGAVEAHLSGRSRLALGLALAACLIRPEAWPFAALYAWHEVRAGTIRPWAAGAGAALVAAAWFLPDLAGAGNPLEGAGRARGADNSPLEALGWAAAMPPAALWAGVVAGVLPWRGHLPAPAGTLVAGALAWIALVAAMAAAGYAGLPRFMVPAIAVLSAVGAAGLVRAATAGRGWVAAAAGAAALALAVQAGVRAADVPGELERIGDDSAAIADLRDLAAADPGAFSGCGGLWTSDFLTHTPLAWQLDLPLSAIVTTGTVAPADGRLVVGARTDPALAARTESSGVVIAADDVWLVFGTGSCARDQARSGSTPAVAGVSGARR